MKTIRSNKGFTLVEIMIVVVIIGLLAAMAIPAFQKVRRDSIKKTMVNDARIVSNAAQQYFMDKGVTTIPSTVLVGAATSNYVKAMSKNNGFVNSPLTSDSAYTFGVSNALVGTSAMTFDNEGHLIATGDPY
jgi:type IV pilus assembly protein PilA